MSDNDTTKGVSRRTLLGTTAAAAGVGLAGGAGLATIDTADAQTKAAPPKTAAPKAPAARPRSQDRGRPGELDEYYVYFSSVRPRDAPLACVDARMKRVPVFNRCSATGLGQTNESLKILTEGLTPDSAKVPEDPAAPLNGDLHHPHISFTEAPMTAATPFMNVKATTRVARVRLDVMSAQDHPAAEPAHRSRFRVQKYPLTGYVFCNGEDGVRCPTTARSSTSRRIPLDHHGGRRRHHEGACRSSSTATTTTSTPTTGQVLLRHLL